MSASPLTLDGRPGSPLTLRSRREIKLMRKPGLVVWEAHQRAAEIIEPGVRTRDIDRVVEEVFRRHDAIPLFKGYPGAVPFPACTCVSVNEEVVHGIPGDRQLAEGDIVSLDTGCKIGGWCGDAAFTHPVGKISPDDARLLDVTRQTLDLAIELLTVKRRWSQVARELEKHVKAAGFATVEDFVGHGIGREMHEQPQVPHFDSEESRKSDFELRPGLVLAIEPMVNAGTKAVRCLKDHWTVVTRDGKRSAHFEHTVAITKEGATRLTAAPEDD